MCSYVIQGLIYIIMKYYLMKLNHVYLISVLLCVIRGCNPDKYFHKMCMNFGSYSDSHKNTYADAHLLIYLCKQ
jgi:hypothetical protein